MIYGVGIDLQDVGRMAQALKPPRGARLISRIAHSADRKAAPRKASAPRLAQYWASRWAAKEAFAKALGTGIGEMVALTDVGVSKDRLGKPSLVFSTRLKGYMKRCGITDAYLSLSHTSSNAVAVVILVRK